jgi:hypothetical protein
LYCRAKGSEKEEEKWEGGKEENGGKLMSRNVGSIPKEACFLYSRFDRITFSEVLFFFVSGLIWLASPPSPFLTPELLNSTSSLTSSGP